MLTYPRRPVGLNHADVLITRIERRELVSLRSLVRLQRRPLDATRRWCRGARGPVGKISYSRSRVRTSTAGYLCNEVCQRAGRRTCRADIPLVARLSIQVGRSLDFVRGKMRAFRIPSDFRFPARWKRETSPPMRERARLSRLLKRVVIVSPLHDARFLPRRI